MSKRFTITVPDELYTLLTKQAEKDLRTLSQEIAYLLRDRLMPASPTFVSHDTPGGLHYPPGVRCAENPTGEPLITNDLTVRYEE